MANGNSNVKDEPRMVPGDLATEEVGGTAGASIPDQMTESQVRNEAAAGVTEHRPTAQPPQLAQGEQAAGGVTATWRTGAMVTALWSINEIRNGWMYVSGIGWKKIYNGRDGAYSALMTLASQARQTGRAISFREEADGMVYEIYLW